MSDSVPSFVCDPSRFRISGYVEVWCPWWPDCKETMSIIDPRLSVYGEITTANYQIYAYMNWACFAELCRSYNHDLPTTSALWVITMSDPGTMFRLHDPAAGKKYATVVVSLVPPAECNQAECNHASRHGEAR